MSYDYWAYYAIAQRDTSMQQRLIQDWLGTGHFPAQLQHLAHVSDLAVRIQLLTQTLATRFKDAARMGTRQSPGGVAQLYHNGEFDRYLSNQCETYLTPLGLTPTLPDLACFPLYSLALTLTFTLRTPYISKDDVSLHLFDNPVRKEKVFQIPMVAATGWKGALRAAMTHQLAEWWSSLDDTAKAVRNNRKRFVTWRLRLVRLFGTEKGVLPTDDAVESYLDKRGGNRLAHWYRRYMQRWITTNGSFAGRLHFFPTFFTKIELDVINPHDRATGAGKQPIYIECVPAAAEGTWMLLYVPHHTPGQTDAAHRTMIAGDLTLLAEGINALFTIYGFGAKTSSGFGIAQPDCAGSLILQHPDPIARSGMPVAPPLPDSVRLFRGQYPAEDFTLKPQDWRKKNMATNRDQDAYKVARAAFATYQEQMIVYQQQKAAWETVGLTPPPMLQRSFTSFQALTDMVTAVAKMLAMGGAG